MATVQEKAQCVQWLMETKSPTQTQRNYRRRYGKAPPSRPSLKAWYDKFMETGSVGDKQRCGRPKTADETVERIQEAYAHSPTKSIRMASRQLQVPRSTVHRILHKQLGMRAYKVQLLQKLEPNDKPRRKDFAFDMLTRMAEDGNFLERICFSDEAIFHVSGKINKHNVRIWGSENPHVTRELE